MVDNESLQPIVQNQGVLEGHVDWVTSIVAGFSQKENEDPNILISGSRDKSVIIWRLNEQEEDGHYGTPAKSLTGHSHFISDLALSSDNSHLISASWDKTLRLWDLKTGTTKKQFVGHEKEVFSVALSPENRIIISGDADKKIKYWNILGDLKSTSDKYSHTDWISCVRFSPLVRSTTKAQTLDPYFVTTGWDGRLKIWSINFQIKYSFKAHDGNINHVAIAPNAKRIATGGKDKKLNIWDITDLQQPFKVIDAGSTINQIAFNPKMQWVAAATEKGVKVWEIIHSQNKVVAEMVADPDKKKKSGEPAVQPQCTSLAWNALGQKLFAGFSDGLIRVYHFDTTGVKK